MNQGTEKTVTVSLISSLFLSLNSSRLLSSRMVWTNSSFNITLKQQGSITWHWIITLWSSFLWLLWWREWWEWMNSTTASSTTAGGTSSTISIIVGCWGFVFGCTICTGKDGCCDKRKHDQGTPDDKNYFTAQAFAIAACILWYHFPPIFPHHLCSIKLLFTPSL